MSTEDAKWTWDGEKARKRMAVAEQELEQGAETGQIILDLAHEGGTDKLYNLKICNIHYLLWRNAMKAQIKFALIMIFIGIVGVHSGAANCAPEYSGEHHSLFVADINHPCPNDYSYAEYNLYGDGGDFDLFVLDSWNNSWYSSETAGNNEYLKVPIHCGYGHTAYVWAYNGSGSWSVCSPQITYDAGFRQIADSDTAPDAEASATTTTTATGSANPELVGRWILTFDWECDGDPDEGELIFNSDGSFGDDDNLNKGEWSKDGQSIRWEHDEDPKALYRGSVSGLYMSGTMSTIDGSTGCWTARKAI